MRPVSKAKFLGVEIDNTFRFKNHIQDLALRAEKRLNILKILAWGGTEPKILIRLYKTFIRSLFEYSAVCIVQCPDTVLDILQKIQNKAIRIALRLPRYIRIADLHKNACLPTVKERLHQLGLRLLGKMKTGNPLVREIVREYDTRNIQLMRQQGLKAIKRSHCSPLDILLPAQRPVLNSS